MSQSTFRLGAAKALHSWAKASPRLISTLMHGRLLDCWAGYADVSASQELAMRGRFATVCRSNANDGFAKVEHVFPRSASRRLSDNDTNCARE